VLPNSSTVKSVGNWNFSASDVTGLHYHAKKNTGRSDPLLPTVYFSFKGTFLPFLPLLFKLRAASG
jgi:hypothetical protein